MSKRIKNTIVVVCLVSAASLFFTLSNDNDTPSSEPMNTFQHHVIASEYQKYPPARRPELTKLILSMASNSD